MASPNEAFGIDAYTAERMGRLPATDIATYLAPWLPFAGEVADPRKGAIAGLARIPREGEAAIVDAFGGDLRAMHVEFCSRLVRNILGPGARIEIGEDNG